MKIAYIGIKGLPSKAGVDRVVEAIVQRLADKHESTVYCSALVIPPNATYPGVKLIRVPALSGKHLHATSLFLMSAIHALTQDFDLIHLHTLEASFIVPLLKLKFKVIVTSHSNRAPGEKWGILAKRLILLARRPAKFADRITTVSKPQVEYSENQFGKTVEFIPNGVDIEEISDLTIEGIDLLNQHRIEPNNYILFAAGRVLPTKGADILLNAYQGLQTKKKLLIVGDASHSPEFDNELHQLADSRVVFIPFLDKNTLLSLVNFASFFVFPSTGEGMSMMLLEVASQGTPIICSDIPENTSVLSKNVLYFKNRDSIDLLSKMEWAHQHPDFMQDIGTSAKAWVFEHYRWDSIIPQYDRLYRSVAGQVDKKNNKERATRI